MKKKIPLIFLCCIFLFLPPFERSAHTAPALVVFPIGEGQITTSGSSLPWTLYENGTLEVGPGHINGLFSISPWSGFDSQITRIVFLGPVTTGTNLQRLFDRLTYLETIENLNYLDTSTASNMHELFRNTSSLRSLDLSTFNTSNVTTMYGMFTNASSLTSLDLSGWDTSNVTAMNRMFEGTTSLESLNISTWNTENVLTMSRMFFGANALPTLDLSSFSTQSVSHMAQMFQNTTSLSTLSFGEDFAFLSTTPANLPPVPNNHTYTGFWTNVGNGPLYSPQGTHVLTSAQLMNPANASILADTWVWQRQVPLISLTFHPNGGLLNGLPQPYTLILTSGETIGEENMPIPTRADYDFLGWQENDMPPLLSNAQVGAIPPTTSLQFTAQWEAENNEMLHLSKRQAYLIGTDGFIHPNQYITRAEVATILFRSLTNEARIAYWTQENPYTDVTITNWYNNAVSTMYATGIFSHFSADTFKPALPVTRGEMANLLVRFVGELGDVSLLETPFHDTLDHWAAPYIHTAAANAWVLGHSDGSFLPDEPITRAEASAMINRMSNRLIAHTDDLLPDMKTWPDNLDPTAWYYFYIQGASNSYLFFPTGEEGKFEQWVSIIPPPNWAVLELKTSQAEDILL